MRQRSKRVYSREDGEHGRAVAQRGARAIREIGLIRRGEHPEKNLIRQRSILLAAGIDVVEWLLVIDGIKKSLAQMMYAETPNANLPWSQDEDNALVQWRSEDMPLHKIASNLGRSPAACATRISTLVGASTLGDRRGILIGDAGRCPR